MFRFSAPLTVLVLLLLAGCGGDDNNASSGSASTQQSSSSTSGGGAEQASAQGKQAFTQNCGGCHTLKDAATNGQVGPNLDELAPDKDTVERQMVNGGGQMPSFKGKLSQDQIDAVATYVSSVAGKS